MGEKFKAKLIELGKKAGLDSKSMQALQDATIEQVEEAAIEALTALHTQRSKGESLAKTK